MMQTMEVRTEDSKLQDLLNQSKLQCFRLWMTNSLMLGVFHQYLKPLSQH